MSVCFFVPAEQAGTSAEEVVDQEALEESGDSVLALQQFWKKVNDDIKHINADDFKTQALPLARIKKIMKLDDEVKMISSEAPVMFAKAAEIFIHELTLRAWEHTDSNRRRTLQRNDIAMAISKSDQFDFLIDIVPRHEVKPVKHPSDPLRVSERQVSPPPQPVQGSQPQFVVQQPQVAQVIQQSNASGASSNSPHPVTFVRHLSGPQQSAEVPQVPLQLTQEQLNMIRLQLQQNPNQPIIIQAARQQQTPQIIQVSSQGQIQPQQMFLAQVSNNQEDS